jgi:hydrogenase/urease accessory protein HupE
MFTKLKLIIVVFLLFLASTNTAGAHALSASFGSILIEEERITYTFSIDNLSVMENIQLDANSDNLVSQEEVDSTFSSIAEWLTRNLFIQVDGVTLRPMIDSMVVEKRNDQHVTTTTLLFDISSDAKNIVLTDQFYKDSRDKTTYTQLLTINQNGNTSEMVLKGDNRTWSTDLVSGEVSTKSSSFSFFALGMEHILKGFDHLLFLLALLLARQSFKDYIKVVTAFTIAHSITLTLGYLDIINLPSYLVESFIALSIVYVAIENIVRKEVKSRWVLTFFFGLIHGLGFAGLLLEMAIPKKDLVISLLSFNLGIEAIQVLLVALVIPLLSRVQHFSFYPKIMKFGSLVMIVVGSYWVIQRLLG